MYDPFKAKAKVVLFTAVAFLFGLGVASSFGWTSVSHAMPAVSVAPQVAPEAVQPALDLSEAFTNLSEAVTPAVVRIESRRAAETASIPDDVLRRFGVPPGAEPDGGTRQRVSGGSGFIVSDDGYILTNNHVVAGANEVTVYLQDRRYFTAEIIGADPFTDVAVIKIDAGEALPSMSFGNSDDVKVGEWILAIGNPGLGNTTQLSFTVTAGIVSARGRGLQLLQNDLLNDPRYGQEGSQWAIEDFIQTDAVINPGNSGGPMVNLHGQVVGINSAIASTTGAYQGYGFAIPVNLARRVMEDLVEYGHVRRPRIGVAIGTVSPEDAELYGLPSIAGVLIQEVQPGPSQGLLQREDVIVAVDGHPVGYTAELQGRIAEYRPGDRVTLTVYRDREPVDVTIRLGDAPINDVQTVAVDDSDSLSQRLGIVIEPLDEDAATELGYSSPGGVVLAEIVPGSSADRRNVGQFLGTRLVRIGDEPIETTDDVSDVLSGFQSQEIVQLWFQDREGNERYINVRMP